MTHAHSPALAVGTLRSRALTRSVLLVSVPALAASAFLGIATASPAAATVNTAELRSSVLKLTNDARKAAGCEPLKANSQLEKAAQAHAKDMSKDNYFDHYSEDGRSFDQRITAAGFEHPGAENIAYGISRASAVMKAWMRSPDHRRNIQNCDLHYLGVGFAGHGNYWVQDFGY